MAGKVRRLQVTIAVVTGQEDTLESVAAASPWLLRAGRVMGEVG
jgi:hypothetical protein